MKETCAGKTLLFCRRRTGVLLVPLPLMHSLWKSKHKLAKKATEQVRSVAFLLSQCWAFLQAPNQRQRAQKQNQFVFACLFAVSKTPCKSTDVHFHKSDLFLAARHRFSQRKREKWGRKPFPLHIVKEYFPLRVENSISVRGEPAFIPPRRGAAPPVSIPPRSAPGSRRRAAAAQTRRSRPRVWR